MDEFADAYDTFACRGKRRAEGRGETISGIVYRELAPADRDSVCALHAGLAGTDGYFRF
ncbi:hypothetical protein ACIO14_18745 [Nocardia fluminea]|uniref:hypothetical protein n=1 Tax=Nocardia fluminea TaxID=134984 RepID=UPI0037F4E814